MNTFESFRAVKFILVRGRNDRDHNERFSLLKSLFDAFCENNQNKLDFLRSCHVNPVSYEWVDPTPNDRGHLVRSITASIASSFPKAIESAIDLSRFFKDAPVTFGFNYGPITVCGLDDPQEARIQYFKKAKEECAVHKQANPAPSATNDQPEPTRESVKMPERNCLATTKPQHS